MEGNQRKPTLIELLKQFRKRIIFYFYLLYKILQGNLNNLIDIKNRIFSFFEKFYVIKQF